MKITKTIGLCVLGLGLMAACNNSSKQEQQTANSSKNANSPSFETIKYDKVGLFYKHPGQNVVDEIEVYVSENGDTIFNQMRRLKAGEIDPSISKYYTLDLKGEETDSILKGTLRIFSPGDTIATDKLAERQVTFNYLQRVGDTLIWKEIQTDKAVIHFDFRTFNKKTFMGFVTDHRYFKMTPGADQYLLVENFFAIDSKKQTENPFIRLLKENEDAAKH